MPSTDKIQAPSGPALIELVANEMFDLIHADHERQASAEKVARRVVLILLDAIREPTEAMLDDALRVSDDDDATSALRGIWRAMIAALKREIAE